MDTTRKLGFGVQAVALATLWATPAAAINMRVLVPGLKPQGQVVISLYKDPGGWRSEGKPFSTVTVPVRGGAADVRFTGLTYSQYAIVAFQDLDGDGKLKTLYGWPREPVGYSRGAKAWFGRPSFDDAGFTLTEDQRTTVFVRLK